MVSEIVPFVCRGEGALRPGALQPKRVVDANYGVMSETEDYPGPTHRQPEKQGQDPRGRADEDMVKPASNPKPEPKKDKVVESPREVSH
jgi:hypothetical protein